MGNPKYQEDGDQRTSGPGFAIAEHPSALDSQGVIAKITLVAFGQCNGRPEEDRLERDAGRGPASETTFRGRTAVTANGPFRHRDPRHSSASAAAARARRVVDLAAHAHAAHGSPGGVWSHHESRRYGELVELRRTRRISIDHSRPERRDRNQLARASRRRPVSTTVARKHLTIADLCDELGIARSTFYDWRAKGRAPRCIKLFNGDLRIRRTEFERWLAEHEDAAVG